VGTVAKLVRSTGEWDHPILTAMKPARRFEELDVSKVDWCALAKDLTRDVETSKVLDEIGSDRLFQDRIERTRDFELAIKKARDLFTADRDDDGRISKFYPFPRPDLLAVLSNLKNAAQEALRSLRSTVDLHATKPKFLYAVTERMAQTFERYFKVEAKPYTSRTESPRRDGPFLRMAQFALREYGDKEHKLSTIATELDKIRAEANRSVNTVPAPEEQ
jgi:hypothetical protein